MHTRLPSSSGYVRSSLRLGTRFKPQSTLCGAVAMVFFTACTLYAQSTYTWTGGGSDNNWSSGANWSGGSAPSNPQAYLNFAGSTQLASNNNLADFGSGFQIYFNSGAGAFTLTGNAINFFNYGSNNPVIENDSASLQTISIKQIDAENPMSLNATSGSLSFTSPFYLDNSVTLTANANTGKTITFSGSINNGGGSTGRVTISGAGLTVFAAANGYTGETDINAGTLRVDVAPSNSTGTYYVGDGGAAGTAAALNLGNGSAGGLSFSNAITENAGSGSDRIIGGSNTGGTNTYNGTVTISDSNANFLAATGGKVEFNTVTASSSQIVTVGGGGNNGTVSFIGTSDNLNIGATVNSGTLLLAKTSIGGAHAIGSGLTVNTGGTVMLGGSGGDQIYNSAAMTLNGGTFAPNGNSEGTGASTTDGGATHSGTSAFGIGAFNLSSNSILDFGTSGKATVTFTSFSASPGSVLDITSWASSALLSTGRSGVDGSDDRLIFDQNESSNLSDFSFNGTPAGQISLGDGYFEIVPIPEPASWAGSILLLGGGIAVMQRRRLRALFVRA